jgi:hypothetical protein
VTEAVQYTTQLQAGLGLVEETKLLLSIYEPGQTSSGLYESALNSGLFPMVSARRLRNIVSECFAPRYIKQGGASELKRLSHEVSTTTLNQLLMVYTAGANLIFRDFVREVYWPHYAGGRSTISLDDAKDFVEQAVRDGKTQKHWAESTIKRMSSYLIGCCADYGFLSSRRTAARDIQPIRIEQSTVLYLAYMHHLNGLGDNAVINHPSWELFGLEPMDVKDELKRLAKNNWLIVQSAADVVRISWQYKSMDEVVDVIIAER